MKTDDYIIFYTDDDKDDQDIFKDAAREVSPLLNVLTQNDGDELIKLLKEPPQLPDVIFLDLNMPLKNGFEVLKEIREAETIKNLPVIIFSTSDDVSAINATRHLGANLYIPKPSTFLALKNVITYSLSIDWQSFSASESDFVYRTEAYRAYPVTSMFDV